MVFAALHESSDSYIACQAGKALATAFAHMAVEQFGGAIQALGKLQFGQIEMELRLLLRWRQMIGRKGIDVSGVGHENQPLANT